MAHLLPELPYELDALEPHISKETLEYHYGKHHAGYVGKLNAAIEGTDQAEMSLEDLVKNAEGGVFNNAAQIWNHSFYWNCLSPNGGGEPTGDLAAAITASFGSFAEFKTAFTAKAGTLVPSMAHGMAVNSMAQGAIFDVVTNFFNDESMTSEEAVDKLARAVKASM